MFKRPLLGLALTLFTAAPALSATLQLNATALPLVGGSDFSITFDDADGDGLLSFDEVVSFSGYTSGLGISYSELLRVSPVPAETDEPLTTTTGGFPINTWLFGEGSDRTTAQPDAFGYSISAVPIPASGLLLLAGLVAIALMRRRTS